MDFEQVKRLLCQANFIDYLLIWDILRPLWPFLKGTETKYQMKTKRVFISKEQKARYKKEEDAETRRIPQKSSFTNNIANREKDYEELN